MHLTFSVFATDLLQAMSEHVLSLHRRRYVLDSMLTLGRYA